jgi:EAL domain-containing protein (putative c-di-GMP-specific phosphodiesterase class I)
MCRNLNLDCIVEGMETEVQVRVLRGLGCNTMQGYFFSKPMPAAEVLGFLASAHFPVFSEMPARYALS